jgi:hypothetical protein
MKQVFDSWIKGGTLKDGVAWYGYTPNYDTYVSGYKDGNKTGTIANWFEWNIRDGKNPTTFEDLENATEEQIITWRFPTSAINLTSIIPDMGHLSASLLGY